MDLGALSAPFHHASCSCARSLVHASCHCTYVQQPDLSQYREIISNLCVFARYPLCLRKFVYFGFDNNLNTIVRQTIY